MITTTTDRNRDPNARAVSSHTWDEFRQVYPIYFGLACQCGLRSGPYPAVEKMASWPDVKSRERDLLWLDEVDRQVQAGNIRQFLISPEAARKEGLRIFLQRHLLNPKKETSDRDKIDLLVVQYFVLCAPQHLIAAKVDFADVARILEPALGAVEATTLECCEPLEVILESARECRSLRDLVEQGLLEQGRLIKEAAGGMFYDPVALVSICRFNFIFRRTFIQLLHADLRVIGTALNELDRRGLKSIDCRRAGLSAAEPIAKLQLFHQQWKAPFRTDYSKESSFRPYEELMALRDDLEEALGVAPGSVGQRMNIVPPTKPPIAAAPVVKAPVQSAPANAPKQAIPPVQQKSPSLTTAEVDSLEERIWEQLIATPPVRGRSMTTVTVQETRVLLSAWEVAAFISASGQDSDDLRRVIVGRALLAVSIDRRKRFLDFKTLQHAVTRAHAEIPRFQERIDQLKRMTKTDSAVNLGISVKRLLALVEEAEQLQKGNVTQEGRR